MARIWIVFGALNGLVAVGVAALTAHGLDAIGPARLQVVRSAVQMQGWHALALIACGLWALHSGKKLAHVAAAAFFTGIILFCTAVYALGFGQLPLGFLAPVGGVLLMAGWALFAVSALPSR